MASLDKGGKAVAAVGFVSDKVPLGPDQSHCWPVQAQFLSRLRFRRRQTGAILGLFLRAPNPWYLALTMDEKAPLLSVLSCRESGSGEPHPGHAALRALGQGARRKTTRRRERLSTHQVSINMLSRLRAGASDKSLHCSGPSRPARQQSPTDGERPGSVVAWCVHPTAVGGPCLSGSLDHA